jgi:hypothetical protein
VLEWLEQRLGSKGGGNPFDVYKATPISVDPMVVIRPEWDKSRHAVIVAPTLFGGDLNTVSADTFLSPQCRERLNWLIGWLAPGRQMDIAVSDWPEFSSGQPSSLEIHAKLAPFAKEGRLRIWKLTSGIDLRMLPRVLLDPGNSGGSAFFSSNADVGSWLDQLVPAPAYRGPAWNHDRWIEMRDGWETHEGDPFRLPRKLTLRSYRGSEARCMISDFAFCAKRTFEKVIIEDPFVIAQSTNYHQLQCYLTELGAIWSAWPKELVLKSRATEDGSHRLIIEDLRKWLLARGTVLRERIEPAKGPSRKYFHDRRIIFVGGTTDKPKRATVLLTGGIDRYMNVSLESSIVVHDEL